MPKRSERVSRKKFVRTPGGETRVHFIEGKTGKRECALCKGQLHGVPHGKGRAQVRKLAKTERRPSGLFGGVLCSGCRTKIVEEAVKVKHGLKAAEQLTLNIKPFVEQILKRVE